MTEPLPATVQWWHRFRSIEKGLSNGVLTVTLGPTSMGPDDMGQDGKNIAIRDRVFPVGLVTGRDGPLCTYIGSYTRNPDEDDEFGIDDVRPQPSATLCDHHVLGRGIEDLDLYCGLDAGHAGEHHLLELVEVGPVDLSDPAAGGH